MRRRLVIACFVSLMVSGIPLTGLAQDLDCADFATQGDAQATLNADPSDPHRLDGDGNGMACESLPGGGSSSASSTQPGDGDINDPVIDTPSGDEANDESVPLPSGESAGSVLPQSSATCADYDAWEWAQSVFESDPQAYGTLDPDGDGRACPELPSGFAPAFWTDRIPADVEEAEIVRLVDGDTLEVLLDGVSNRVRIYRADTPETQNEQHCGGAEATAFADYALSYNDTPGVVYLERDENERDRFGRELAYVWFASGGDPYMLNHILINNGWAEDVDYGDRKYDAELQDAAAFAERNEIGVWALCGGFQIDLAQEPSAPPPAVNVPDAPAQQPAPPAVVPEPEPVPSNGCDSNYTGCVPISASDLDCPDVGFSMTVIGVDIHGFDREGDGLGCESY